MTSMDFRVMNQAPRRPQRGLSLSTAGLWDALTTPGGAFVDRGKNVLLVVCSVLVFSSDVLGQSQLMPCPQSGYKNYCWATVELFGTKYEGEFRADKPDGRGTVTDPGGNRFVGEFKNGKRIGRGFEYLPDGTLSRVGIWSDDNFIMADPGTPSSDVDPSKATLQDSGDAGIRLQCQSQAQPVMPLLALRSGVGGQVKAQARVKDGMVTDVIILSGPSIFHESVRGAMMQYKCTNSATESLHTQQFNFRIDGTSNDLPRTEAEYVRQVAAATPARTMPLRTTIGVSCPTQVPPEMPQKAREENIEGVVKAQVRIKGGVIQDVTILSGPRVFHAAVRAAVMQYRCIVEEREVVAIQEFNFKLTAPPTIIDALIGIFK